MAIDETDRMIEKGHFEELEKILQLINKYDLFILYFLFCYLENFISDDKNQSRQKFVFSATLLFQPDTDEEQKKKQSKKKKKKKQQDDNQDKLGLFTIIFNFIIDWIF